MLGETFDQIYNKFQKDIADAKLEGELKGELSGKMEVAKNMIKKGLKLDFISEVTKIPLSELKKIVSATSINQEKTRSFLFDLVSRVKNIMRSLIK